MALILENKNLQGHVGAQFLGAFNDNLFKQLILLLAASRLFPGEDKQGLAFAVFALPFILFSGMAGDLSERHSKRAIIVLMKFVELGIMIVGAIALQSVSWNLMLAVLFIMGVQSAFFGPSKYGVIPEIVEKPSLLKANGLISMTTFLAVLLGQALAGPLLEGFEDKLWIAGVFCSAFSLIGILFARRIDKLEPQRPSQPIHYNPFSSVLGSIKELRGDSRVVPLLLLFSFFWFTGGVTQQAINGLGGAAYLNISPSEISLLLVSLALSIMAGSISVPIIARRLPRGRMVMIGASTMFGSQLVLALVSTLLGGSTLAYILSHLALITMGYFGAFFVVPIQTFLQDAPDEGTKGKAFAVNNFLNFTFIFLAGIFYMIATKISLPPGFAAAISGGLMFAMALYQRRHVVRIDDAPAATPAAA